MTGENTFRINDSLDDKTKRRETEGDRPSVDDTASHFALG